MAEYDFGWPEDVIIEVLHDPRQPRGWYVVEALVRGFDQVIGAASYEESQGFLNYAIKDLIKEKPDEGFYVIVGLNGGHPYPIYWFYDDHMKLYYQHMRPATEEERLLLR